MVVDAPVSEEAPEPQTADVVPPPVVMPQETALPPAVS